MIFHNIMPSYQLAGDIALNLVSKKPTPPTLMVASLMQILLHHTGHAKTHTCVKATPTYLATYLPIQMLKACIAEIRRWMPLNGLKLNES